MAVVQEEEELTVEHAPLHQILEETVEVGLAPLEQVHRRTVEHATAPQILEETVEVVLAPHEQVQQLTVEQVPVPQILEEAVEVVRLVPRERVQQPIPPGRLLVSMLAWGHHLSSPLAGNSPAGGEGTSTGWPLATTKVAWSHLFEEVLV